MPLIAIINDRTIEKYDDEYTTRILLASSITEWTEVTDKELDILLKAARSGRYNFSVIEKIPVDNTLNFVGNTVAAYTKYIALQEEKCRKEELERKRVAAERKAKKLAKQPLLIQKKIAALSAEAEELKKQLERDKSEKL